MISQEKNKIYIHPKIDPAIFDNLTKLAKKREKEEIRDVPILEAKKLEKKFGNNLVIPKMDFKIEDIIGKSEIIGLLGPSGCGKSTLLNLISGLYNPTSGGIYIKGKIIDGPGMDRGLIFQKYSSFPFLNVIENISYPLIKVKKMNKNEAQEKAKYWVDKMYLKGAEYKYPHQLSGGMQQRVSIARTLCMEASVILMDEPFGALDRKIRWEMQDLLAEILFFNPIQEVTVILVTHDISEAVFLGDRIWVMNKGEIVSITFVERPTAEARFMYSHKDFIDMINFFNDKLFNLEIKK